PPPRPGPWARGRPWSGRWGRTRIPDRAGVLCWEGLGRSPAVHGYRGRSFRARTRPERCTAAGAGRAGPGRWWRAEWRSRDQSRGRAGSRRDAISRRPEVIWVKTFQVGGNEVPKPPTFEG